MAETFFYLCEWQDNLCFAESETNLAIRSLLIASRCSKLDNIIVSVCLVVKLRSYDTERTIFGSTFSDITWPGETSQYSNFDKLRKGWTSVKKGLLVLVSYPLHFSLFVGNGLVIGKVINTSLNRSMHKPIYKKFAANSFLFFLDGRLILPLFIFLTYWWTTPVYSFALCSNVVVLSYFSIADCSIW